MKIMLLDLVQTSDAPDEVKSPALADKWMGRSLIINLGGQKKINAVGIGYTDANNITVEIGEASGTTASGTTHTFGITHTFAYTDSGLYMIGDHRGSVVRITIDGSYVGRIGIGMAHNIPISPRREPGYVDPKPRETVSAQLLPPVGEVSRRKISVDVRYRITAGMIAELGTASLARSFPYFLLFDQETTWLPWRRLYARDKNRGALQSSVNRMIFSRKFDFVECF